MLTNEEKEEILSHVLRQKEFLRSPTSSVLLSYLVKAGINGKNLKETTIGMDLLGDKFNADQESARIRVNVYNLRKKLDKYYEGAGRQDKWRIRLEKGIYRPEFIPGRPPRNRKKVSRSVVWWLLAALILSWGIFFRVARPGKVPVIWNSFFHNGKETTLFIGDSFGLMGKLPTGRIGWFRDYQINGLTDFYQWIEENPKLKDKVWQADYLYTTGMAAYASQQIARLYTLHHQKFKIRFSSNTSYSDILESNAIYAGPMKNDNKFIHFFNQGNTRFHLVDEKLYYSDPVTRKDTVINLVTIGLHSEYALVSRLNGPGNTSQLIFFSDHDIGVKATVEYFTCPDSVRAFADRYLGGKDVPFTALFKTWGIARTNIRLKPVFISKINP